MYLTHKLAWLRSRHSPLPRVHNVPLLMCAPVPLLTLAACGLLGLAGNVWSPTRPARK